MISTILIEKDTNELQKLVKKIEKLCPAIKVKGIGISKNEAYVLSKEFCPELIIINPGCFSSDLFRQIESGSHYDPELIFVSNSSAYSLKAIAYHAIGYLLKPIQDHALISSVEDARIRVREKAELRKKNLLLDELLSSRHRDELIGIPEIKGFEFVHISEIIRCEGLQSCTRVITTSKTDIISSYNIGEFKKLLEPYGFFSPHKSHLINLSFVKHYKREGTIILKDNSSVPVAKRRKSEFLKQVIHL